MAYGNWGAFVYKNGIRETNREDNIPYQEDSLEAGYWQLFRDGRDKVKVDTHHASLGSGDFRLCGYKSIPIIFYNSKQIPLDKYYIPDEYSNKIEKYENETLTVPLYWGDSFTVSFKELCGTIGGYKFRAIFKEAPERVVLYVLEPDGTKWEGVSGFGLGKGHDKDDSNAKNLIGKISCA